MLTKIVTNSILLGLFYPSPQRICHEHGKIYRSAQRRETPGTSKHCQKTERIVPQKSIGVLALLHTDASGPDYTRFKPEYCREILRHCEFVDTPVHGQLLEHCGKRIECVDETMLVRTRIGSMDEVCKQVAAWTAWRNDHAKGVHWQFTTDNARIKLDSVYPKFHFDNK